MYLYEEIDDDEMGEFFMETALVIFLVRAPEEYTLEAFLAFFFAFFNLDPDLSYSEMNNPFNYL